MDINTAIAEVLKNALIVDGLARGLREAAKVNYVLRYRLSLSPTSYLSISSFPPSWKGFFSYSLSLSLSLSPLFSPIFSYSLIKSFFSDFSPAPKSYFYFRLLTNVRLCCACCRRTATSRCTRSWSPPSAWSTTSLSSRLERKLLDV